MIKLTIWTRNWKNGDEKKLAESKKSSMLMKYLQYTLESVTAYYDTAGLQ